MDDKHSVKKDRLRRVLQLMANGWTLKAGNGLAYCMNDIGELCYVGHSGGKTVSGMSFNEFHRMVNAYVGELPALPRE